MYGTPEGSTPRTVDVSDILTPLVIVFFRFTSAKDGGVLPVPMEIPAVCVPVVGVDDVFSGNPEYHPNSVFKQMLFVVIIDKPRSVP
jgi:hypothetical protein